MKRSGTPGMTKTGEARIDDGGAATHERHQTEPGFVYARLMSDAPLRTVIVCVNDRGAYGPASCTQRGSRDIVDALAEWLPDAAPNVELERVVCLAHCQFGPTVRMIPGDFITGATVEVVKAAIRERIITSSTD